MRRLQVLERRRSLTLPMFVPSPAHRDGVPIVADSDGDMLRLDAPSFDRIWSRPCEEYWPSRVVDNVVLARNFKTAALRCFDLTSGRLLWEKATNNWYVVWRNSILMVGDAAEFVDARSGQGQRQGEWPVAGEAVGHFSLVAFQVPQVGVACLWTVQRMWNSPR